MEKAILNVYKFYQERLKILNSCDFGDLILLCVNMFENNSDILELYLNNFKYILVDEYQDSNYIQSKWLNLLAKKITIFVALEMMTNQFTAGEELK